jgi:hypothetical protein
MARSKLKQILLALIPLPWSRPCSTRAKRYRGQTLWPVTLRTSIVEASHYRSHASSRPGTVGARYSWGYLDTVDARCCWGRALSRPGTVETWHCRDLALSRPGTVKTWHCRDLALSRPGNCETWHCRDLAIARPGTVETWQWRDLALSRPALSGQELTRSCTHEDTQCLARYGQDQHCQGKPLTGKGTFEARHIRRLAP